MNNFTGRLLGQTLASIVNLVDTIVMVTTAGDCYELHHNQDCCETVKVDDIVGDLADVVGSPITMFEEVSNKDIEDKPDSDHHDSYTWTYYKIGTAKGDVNIKWFGSSNGYYSEEVNMRKLKTVPEEKIVISGSGADLLAGRVTCKTSGVTFKPDGSTFVATVPFSATSYMLLAMRYKKLESAATVKIIDSSNTISYYLQDNRMHKNDR